MPTIQSISTNDFRRKLKDGAGSDAVHTDPSYGYGVTLLGTDTGLTGTGIAYTLGDGTNLVCEAIRILAEPLQGREIEELMAEFGAVQRSLAEHPGVRWLGPHKGVTHLALASITATNEYAASTRAGDEYPWLEGCLLVEPHRATADGECSAREAAADGAAGEDVDTHRLSLAIREAVRLERVLSDEILQRRASLREQHGWIMDIYLLAKQPLI